MGEFPGGPVIRSPCSHCRGPRFNPGRGTRVSQASQRGEAKKKKKDVDWWGRGVVREMGLGRTKVNVNYWQSSNSGRVDVHLSIMLYNL